MLDHLIDEVLLAEGEEVAAAVVLSETMFQSRMASAFAVQGWRSGQTQRVNILRARGVRVMGSPSADEHKRSRSRGPVQESD